MDDLNKTTKEVNDTLQSNGWLVIEELFETQLKALDKISNIDSKLPTDEYKIASLANQKANEIITSVLEAVKQMVKMEPKKKKKYV